MVKKKTHEEFLLQMKEVHKNSIEVIGKYEGSNKKILLKCKICDEYWSPTGQGAIRNTCGNCCKIKKINNNKVLQHKRKLNLKNTFLETIPFIRNGKYKMTGTYVDSQTNTEMECSLHGRFFTTPTEFIRGRNLCKKCSIENTPQRQAMPHKEFVELLENKSPNQYELLSIYRGYKVEIKIKHLYCGNVSNVLPGNLLRGSKYCKFCNPTRQKTNEEFNKELLLCGNNEYELLNSTYIDMYTKITLLHKKCGNSWGILPVNFIHNNSRCPFCKSSKGELLIREILTDNKLFFDEQKRFSECKITKPLPFDFHLTKNVNSIIIEYDGEQHFIPVDFGNKGGEWAKEQFDKNQRNDKIKNKYCIANNIPLIRIPYKQQKNIEYILQNVLIHFGLIENKQDTYDKDIVMKYLVNENWDHEKYIEENK